MGALAAMPEFGETGYVTPAALRASVEMQKVGAALEALGMCDPKMAVSLLRTIECFD